MKVLLLLGLVLVAAKSVIAAANDMGAVPSLENGMIRATTAYETFMQASYNGKIYNLTVWADTEVTVAYSMHLTT